jgi:hypothetical protein
MSFFPWNDAKDKISLVVRHVRAFLKANLPA